MTSRLGSAPAVPAGRVAVRRAARRRSARALAPPSPRRRDRAETGRQPAPSLFAASRKFLTVAVGGLRPSSFSPLAVDPDHGHVHLQHRRDVGLVAAGDVHPALLAADPPRALLEVGRIGLVAAHLLGRDHQVELGSQVTTRDAEQLVVDVGDDPDVVALGEPVHGRVRLAEGQPAGDAVGQELGARGLELPADLIRGTDGRAPQHLGVELVRAADDLGLDLEEALR